jgi:putative flippase GtrA
MDETYIRSPDAHSPGIGAGASGSRSGRTPLGSLLRFGITGLAATAIHVLVATALIELGGRSQVTANVVAFCTANVFSYLVNTLWSFAHRLGHRSLLRFWLVSLVALGLTTLVSALAQALHLHYLLGILMVVTVVPALTFLGHRFWTYRA